uniref:solute carrier family 35 member F4-like n=1 Tax=Myxine glutinosa TaxID=7769 RepID=UPI00358F0F66
MDAEDMPEDIGQQEQLIEIHHYEALCHNFSIQRECLGAFWVKILAGDESPGTPRGEPVQRELTGAQLPLQCTSQQVRRLAWGGVTLLATTSCLVAASQLARVAFEQVDTPFFLTWLTTCGNITAFPLYYLAHLVTAPEKQSPLKIFRECTHLLGEEGVTVCLFLKRTTPFCCLIVLTHYFYLLALRSLPASDVAALFCCNEAFVFLLSWIVLKDRFMGIRIVAAILAITGIVMMVYVEDVPHNSMVGVALAVGAASTSALYKVLFKMILGSPTLGQTSQLLSFLGLFNLVAVSVIPIILYVTGVEFWHAARALPWLYLCGVACLLLVFNFLVHFGLVVTFSTFISLGVLLSVPGNAVVELLQKRLVINAVRLSALALISFAFLLLLLPENWDTAALHALKRLRSGAKRDDVTEEQLEAGAQTRSRSRVPGTSLATC